MNKFVLIFLVIPVMIVNGFVISQLWEWFIIPIFGMGMLSIPSAMGLSIFIAYFTPTMEQDESADKVALMFVTTSISKPIIYLSLGWIVSYWI